MSVIRVQLLLCVHVWRCVCVCLSVGVFERVSIWMSVTMRVSMFVHICERACVCVQDLEGQNNVSHGVTPS